MYVCMYYFCIQIFWCRSTRHHVSHDNVHHCILHEALHPMDCKTLQTLTHVITLVLHCSALPLQFPLPFLIHPSLDYAYQTDHEENDWGQG